MPFVLITLFVITKTGSRGAWFSLLAGLFGFCMILPMNKKYRILSWIVTAAGAGGFIAMVMLGRGFTSMKFRLDYFYAAFRMMLKQPLTGSGWGDFFHDYLRLKLLYNNEAPHSPHNMFLLFGSQTGILGMILIAAAVILPFIAGVILLRYRFKTAMAVQNGKISEWFQGKNGILSGIFAGFMIFWADAMLEISFECPAFICYFNLTALLLFSLLRQDRIKNQEVTDVRTEENSVISAGTGDKKIIPGTLSVSLLLAIMACFTVYKGYTMGVREYHYGQLQNHADPRFRNGDLMQRPATVDSVSRLLQKAVEAGPDSPFPYAEAARFFYSSGELSLADESISKAIQRAPLRSGFYLFRAKIRYQMSQKDIRKALPDLEKMRQVSPRNPEYFVPDLEILTEK